MCYSAYTCVLYIRCEVSLLLHHQLKSCMERDEEETRTRMEELGRRVSEGEMKVFGFGCQTPPFRRLSRLISLSLILIHALQLNEK